MSSILAATLQLEQVKLSYCVEQQIGDRSACQTQMQPPHRKLRRAGGLESEGEASYHDGSVIVVPSKLCKPVDRFAGAIGAS